jgi:hypothetical protein
LTVTSPYGTVGGQGWYDSGATAYATLNIGVVDHGNGTRRVFTNWDRNASGTDYAQSDPIVMNGPKTAVANWKTQYKLVVRTNGLGTRTTNVYNGATILGTATDATPFTGWFDQNALIQLDIDSPVYGSPTRSVFTQWTGDATGSSRPVSVTMSLPKDITANYKIQYEVTFTHTGLDSSATGTVVTVNGVPKTFSELPYRIWVDHSTVITYSYSNVSSTTTGKRFILTSVTGPTSPTTVTSPVTITGNYKTQYQITITGSPSGASGGKFKVTYTQCGTTYTSVQKTTPWAEWIDASTTVTVSEPQDIINIAPGTRYKFDSYSPSHSVTMDQSRIITLVYKTQYYLTVRTDLVGLNPAPTPTSDWYGEGTTVTLTAPSFSFLNTVRYRLGYWDVDSVTAPGNPITVLMDMPHTATAHYTMSVGGVWVPMNKPELLAPWLGYASVITVATASLVCVRRRKKRQN